MKISVTESGRTRRWSVLRLAREQSTGHRPRTGPRLAAHEHALIQDRTVDRVECVGTDHALHLLDSYRGDRLWQRIGWTDVASISSQRSPCVVTLRLWPEHEQPVLRLTVGSRSRLPQFLVERVTACQVAIRRVAVTDHCSATITALRDPASGDISWTVRLTGDNHRDDPQLDAAVEQALAEERADLGC